MLVLFGATLFISAALLFLIQPMFAKMVLPLLGGAPAIWITAVMFFQAALLAGYAYAHWSIAWLGARRQALVHGGLLLLPLLSLPITIPRDWTPPTSGSEPAWLVALLFVSLGLPFFVLASTAPLLQRWIADTSHRAASDPYFLYAASNLGSMVGLLAYPVLVEPTLRLADQRLIWARGYWALAVLTVACAALLWASRRVALPQTRVAAFGESRSASGDTREGLSTIRRIHWLALAFVPSSFMLAVTTYLTTDIAAIPLLWVIPLALYLLTFIVAFSRRPMRLYSLVVQVIQPFVLLALVFLIVFGATGPPVLLIPLNLAALFVSALVCHCQLATDRPETRSLTEFYLWVALGGVLGGVFNAVVAPAIFDSILEYPLVIVLACLLRPPPTAGASPARAQSLDVVLPLALGLLALGIAWGFNFFTQSPAVSRAIALVVAIIGCSTFATRPLRFGLGVAAVMLVAAFSPGDHRDVLYANRTFFGVHRVLLDREGGFHQLIHGNTVHGAQSTDANERREPLTYYHRTGPIGQVFEHISRREDKSRVAIIGLGAGSLACYAQPGQKWTFYEIDPGVERIARDPHLFTFLRDCPADVDVVLGDARLSLVEAPNRHFELIVVDAFNSAAIPVHLLTREAVQLYVSKLTERGIVAFHISNRYLDLRPVLARVARDAGLVSLARDDLVISRSEAAEGKSGSLWMVLSRGESQLGDLTEDPRWEEVLVRRGLATWTDDFSNIFETFKWTAGL